MDYANALKQLRAEMNVSQQKLAELLHVSFISVNRWENGHNEPTVIVRERLKKIFKQYNIVLEKKEDGKENE